MGRTSGTDKGHFVINSFEIIVDNMLYLVDIVCKSCKVRKNTSAISDDSDQI